MQYTYHRRGKNINKKFKKKTKQTQKKAQKTNIKKGNIPIS